ncbi:MAG: dihydroorotate dehydrogenase [Deltaproteobacteria bacterium]|jgi:dihydroorotate dehydrogenase (NAD+) catalytic subunit|nr:dihydroorotate dehydrogenase [Deltaproteobacteria bacterium]
MKPDMTVKIGPLTLKNPILAASGVFGWGRELAEYCPAEKLGAVILKGVSLEPWPGNPGPRALEAAGGLVNSIGLENIGLEKFLAKIGPWLKDRPQDRPLDRLVCGANVIGREPDEYALAAEKLTDSGVDFLELNISCPNLAHGGLTFGADPAQAGRLIEKAVRRTSLPVMVKLPPVVSDMALLAKTAENAGAAALSLINTVPALVIDARTRRALLGNVTGGLSGPPIKPLALRQVWLASRAVKIPVIGLGGIFTGEDAAEFIIAGASAVQIGTAILADPRSPLTILEELTRFLEAENLPSPTALRGTLNQPRT